MANHNQIKVSHSSLFDFLLYVCDGGLAVGEVGPCPVTLRVASPVARPCAHFGCYSMRIKVIIVVRAILLCC